MAATSLRLTLDGLLGEGRAIAQRGEDAAAARLGVGSDPNARARLRETALAGGAAAGVLALLLGQRRRGLGRNAILLGGIGALGRIAVVAWNRRADASVGTDAPLALLGETDAEARAETILHAMISAAMADGHVDEEERSAIEAEMEDLPERLRATFAEGLEHPSDPEAIAARAHGEHERREVYAASALLCGRDDPREIDYLDRLAAALFLSPDEARGIEDDLHPV